MFIRWIYKIIPVPFIQWPVKNYYAKSYGFFVLTNPNPPEAIIQHELTHCRQFWCYGWIGYSLLYRFSKKFRLKFEVEAYRKQLEIAPLAIEPIAAFLANRYGLGITKEEAMRLLRGGNG